MNNSDGTCKSQLHSTMRNRQCILGIFHAAAQHRIDVHLKNRVLRKPFQPAVQRLQTFFRNFVRGHVIDADLQMLQPHGVQTLDPIYAQQESIGDHSRNHSTFADVPDHFFQFRMHQWLAAADGDNRRPHHREIIQTSLHLL